MPSSQNACLNLPCDDLWILPPSPDGAGVMDSGPVGSGRAGVQMIPAGR
jgi:hypothetical protein